MNALSNLVPLLIVYTSLVIYFFNYKISPSINNPEIPTILYLLGTLFVTHGIGSSILSLYASYNHCSRYSLYNMIISALRMFFWVSLATFILFYYDGFITPFKNIWTDSDMNKVNTIAYSFYLSIFTVLTGIIIYYDAKTNSCGPDANYIEKSVKELDNILSGKKELNNTQNNK
jgi:hypothetical protein